MARRKDGRPRSLRAQLLNAVAPVQPADYSRLDRLDGLDTRRRIADGRALGFVQPDSELS